MPARCVTTIDAAARDFSFFLAAHGLIPFPDPQTRKPRPMATRKLYTLLASILKDAHTVQGISPEDVGTVAYALADGLEEDNPRFDREKFLAACAVGDL